MNSAILTILGPPPASAAAAKAITVQSDSTGQSSTANGDAFGLVLAGQVTARAQSSKPAAPVVGDAVRATALAAKIASMLKAGATDAEVTARLAAALAAAVAHALGTTSADARMQLQAAFAGALAPPGHSAASLAERSAALAQRFLHVEAIATNLIGAQTGQQKRIAGNFLDATKAKEIPAPVSVTTLSGASAAGAATGAALTVKADPAAGDALVRAGATNHAAATTAADAAAANAAAANVTAVNAAPATSATMSAATPGAIATGSAAPLAGANVLAQSQSAFTLATAAQSTLTGSGGDGRRVAFVSKALSGGGDSLLGRVLTRAAAAADARASTGALQAANAGADSATAATDEASATIELESAAAGTNTDAQTPAAAFVKSFAAAMATAIGVKTVPDGQPSAVASPLALAAPDGAAPATFVPAVAPFQIERMAPPAMPAPAAPAVTVDQNAIVDQVLRGAFMRNTGESSEMRLSLVPETLGDVNVKLVITGGNVTAHVLAQTPEVRDALIAAQPQLTKSLADAGLKLQSFNVDLAGNGFAGFSQQQGSQWQHGSSRARQTAAADDERDDSTLDAIPSFGPSILTSTFAGDYNYLA